MPALQEAAVFSSFLAAEGVTVAVNAATGERIAEFFLLRFYSSRYLSMIPSARVEEYR